MWLPLNRRFVLTWGVWALPDPCAAERPADPLTLTCVPGPGRVPEYHGSYSNNPGYFDPYIRESWNEFCALGPPSGYDFDDDGIDQAYDPDDDNDGVLDVDDNCVSIANASQTNSDGDAFGDVCDPN